MTLKESNRMAMRRWRLRNPEKVKSRRKEEWQLHPERIRRYKAKYKALHGDRIKAYEVAYRLKNKVKNRQRALAYYHAHKLERKAYSANYHRVNRAAKRDYDRRWRKLNPGRRSLYDSRRRTRMIAAKNGNDEAIVSWENKWRKKRSVTCYWCLDQFSPSECHLDHIIPISKSGKHSLDNVCIACSHCNQSKHNDDPDKWNQTLVQPALIL